MSHAVHIRAEIHEQAERLHVGDLLKTHKRNVFLALVSANFVVSGKSELGTYLTVKAVRKENTYSRFTMAFTWHLQSVSKFIERPMVVD